MFIPILSQCHFVLRVKNKLCVQKDLDSAPSSTTWMILGKLSLSDRFLFKTSNNSFFSLSRKKDSLFSLLFFQTKSSRPRTIAVKSHVAQ